MTDGLDENLKQLLIMILLSIRQRIDCDRKMKFRKKNPSSPLDAGVNGWEHDTTEEY